MRPSSESNQPESQSLTLPISHQFSTKTHKRYFATLARSKFLEERILQLMWNNLFTIKLYVDRVASHQTTEGI